MLRPRSHPCAHAPAQGVQLSKEALAQLEASADNLSLKEQQQQQALGPPAGSEAEAERCKGLLAALEQLRQFESSMAVGQEAEAAAQAEEGGGAS